MFFCVLCLQVTMSTVGYGEKVPITTLGYVVGMLTITGGCVSRALFQGVLCVDSHDARRSSMLHDATACTSVSLHASDLAENSPHSVTASSLL